MMELLQTLESSDFSMWVKESSTAYVAVLAFHTVGLAFLVGISSTAAMRILGVARAIPLAPMSDFFPLMYAGFWINLLTGAVLMCLYPTDYLTEPTIYVKLGAVIIAFVLLRKLQHQVFTEGVDAEAAAGEKSVRRMAGWMIFIWLIATVAGRVMAYSMPTKLQTAAAAGIFLVLALLAGYAIGRSLGWIGTTSGDNRADAPE